MSKLTYTQRENLKKVMITADIHRLTTSETQDMIRDKLGLEMSFGYIAHLKASLKRESEKQIDLYKKDKFAFIEGAFSKRIAELENNQTILNTIIYSNKDKPDVQVKAVLALNETTVLLTNLFQMLPNICNLGADAFGASSNDNDNNNPSSLVMTAAASYSRWCSNCNREHPLDKEGHRKCPGWKVGMDYENEPGYYEREDFDPERQNNTTTTKKTWWCKQGCNRMHIKGEDDCPHWVC